MSHLRPLSRSLRLFALEVADQQLLLEHRRLGHQFALGAKHHRAAVEHQLVLAAHLVRVADEHAVVDGARGQHPTAELSLARVVGRAVDVDDDLRTRLRLRLRRVPGVPDVLAHAQAHAHARHRVRRTALAGAEIAQLVEHAVVGQPLLAVDIGQAAVMDNRRRVVDVVAVHVHEADYGGDAAAALHHRP